MSDNGVNQDPASGAHLTAPSGHRLSLRDLCCLFCCPPCPSNIVSKLAFMPPLPTYKFYANDTGSKYTLQLLEKNEWPYSKSELDQIEVFYTRTSRDNRLACMYVRCCPGAKYTLLFSHGNAVDLGQMCAFFYGLGSRLNCNVFGYDYSGYGASSGKASEKNLYADVEAAWNALHTKYSISARHVILYGQSIGTAPTVDLGARVKPAAIILHSPLMSGMRVAFPDTRRTWCCDAFPSIDKIDRVNSPTLVIHGTEDEVIDFSHGLAIYERCPKSVDPLWVPGAGHNDIELNPIYLDRLRRFINDEVDHIWSTNNNINSTSIVAIQSETINTPSSNSTG
uniref:palmitoyl-protein hydrolase n=1 Tax=Romanomermis culicivorax TaxID=13658 RepID=A0A915KGX6_ROMCU